MRGRKAAGGSVGVAATLALALAAAPALAQGPPALSVERLHADPPLDGSLPTHLAWHPDGRRLTFLRGEGGEARLCSFDVAKGRETVLLVPERLRPVGKAKSELTLTAAAWLPDGRRLLVPSGGDIYLVDVAEGTVRGLVTTPATEELATASPDGKRVAFVRANDLYVVEVASGRELRLTRSGSDTLLNGRLDWAYEEELGGRSGRAFCWAPNSRALAYLQLDQARVARFPIVDFLASPNEVRWQRYPTPGTPNAVVRLGVAALDEADNVAGERLVELAGDGYLLPQLGWTPDSRELAVQVLNRAQNELELRLVSSAAPEPAASRVVLTERSPTWLNTFGAPRFLKNGKRFLWVSERDGFAHLYLCDLAGACRAVTRGAWAVESRVSFTDSDASYVFDERSGFVYFSANDGDPRERHLYRVRLDGTGYARLTHEAGWHRALVSPDGRYYADDWSSTETPPRLDLSSQDGTRHWTVEENAHPPILEFERGHIEPLELSAADGTKLYAALLKPAAFDPARRYPVVLNVYGGPHAQHVTNAWRQASPFDRLLASHGFLVFRLDNRGSSGRGTAFESAIFRKLGRIELEDQLAGVTYLRSLPFVDPERIGIMGWSYGGYLALYAATNAPRAFRAVVAGAPVTDWRLYDSIYSERYMGAPDANPAGYDASSPSSKAGALEADLLLIHGTADDNVHLANTVAFVAALVRAGKAYSLALQPGESHGLSAKDQRLARDRATLAHFVRTLAPRR